MWNIEFARRESDVPLLASCCASGSIRVAPAKRLFRATQHSVELVRLSGEHDAGVNKPYKELSVSFERKIVAEPPSPAVREFCERDAALHRLRVSTSTTGAFPCFIAAGGHAGLVVIMELQETLDSILKDYYLPASRKQGRPRKVGDLWGGAATVKGKPKKAPVVAAGGKKARAVGAKPVKAKKMHTALATHTLEKKKRKPRAPARAAVDLEAEPSPQLDVSEDEYVDDEDEDESTSSLSLMMADDNSEDERVTISSDEMDDEPAAPPSSERARMMSEYQMDLHEEDAIMLAIQMSEMEQTQPSPALTSTTKGKRKAKAKVNAVKSSSDAAVAVAGSAAVPLAKHTLSVSQSGKKKSEPSSSVKQAAHKKSQSAIEASATAVTKTSATVTATKTKKTAVGTSGSGTAAVAAAQTPSTAGKKTSQPKKAVNKTSSGKGSKAAAKYRGGYIMDQVATLQMIQFQNGMTEEDALLEVLRISEAEVNRSSSEEKEASANAVMPVASSSTNATAVTLAASSSANAKAVKPRPTSTSVSAAKKPKKAPAAKAPKAPKAQPSAPVSSVNQSESGAGPGRQTEEAKSSEIPASSLPGDTVIGASKDPEQPQALSSSPAKRKRPATKPTQPRKRPVKSTSGSKSKPAPVSAGSKSSDAQVANGYLTDEEALYLALRASEVEY